jgi:hypothetical protein
MKVREAIRIYRRKRLVSCGNNRVAIASSSISTSLDGLQSPGKPSDDIAPGPRKSILRQAGLKEED